MFSLGMASAPRRPLAAHRRGARGQWGRLADSRRARRLALGQLGPLGLEVGRELGVGVIEHRERIGRGGRLEALHGVGNFGVDLRLDVALEKTPPLQIGAEAGERILLLPHRDFFLAPVLRRIVGGGVHAEPIRHALDQRGPVAGARPIDGLARGRVDGEDVVAVHLDAGQPVGERLLGDRARVGLLLQRHRDRPLVVLADEHHRHVPDPGEVHGLVKVALGGRAVAEVGHDDGVVAAVLSGIGQAHRVRQLRRHRDRDRQVVLVVRGPSALDVAGEEEQELFDRPAAPDHRGRLAERRHHPVGLPEGEYAPDLRGFLTFDGRESPDASLALQAHHTLVEAPAQHHRAVERLQLVGRQLRLEGSVEVAFAVEDRQVLNLESRLEGNSGHWGGQIHSNPRAPESYLFAAAFFAGAAGAAGSDRLAFARGFFSPEATRLARLSLRASIRSITWARWTCGPTAVTSLPSTFWLMRSRTRWRYSSRYFSGSNSSLARPSISWSASSSSPGLIFADSPRSISPKSRTSSAKYIVCSMRPPRAGRMRTRLSLPRMTNVASATRPPFSIASARRRYALSPPLSGPR